MTPQSEHDEKCPKRPHTHWYEKDDKYRVELYNIKATDISKEAYRNLGATFNTQDSAIKCHDMLQIAINLRGLKGT